MNIAIIGAGNVGGSLGKVWAAKGHTICFGVRNPNSEKTKKSLKSIGHSARALFVKDAALQAEVIVLATPWDSVPEIVFQLMELKDKILLDCTNPINPNPEWPLSQGTSAAEEIAKRLPGFRVVKAFNTMGDGNFTDVQFDSVAADGFLCGDDVQAKNIVGRLATEVGLRPVDVGNLRNAELLESLAKLWIALSHQHGVGPNIAFKLLQR